MVQNHSPNNLNPLPFSDVPSTSPENWRCRLRLRPTQPRLLSRKNPLLPRGRSQTCTIGHTRCGRMVIEIFFDRPLTQLVEADLGLQLTPALDIANRVPSLFVTPPTLENVSPYSLSLLKGIATSLLSISIEGSHHVVISSRRPTSVSNFCIKPGRRGAA